MKTPKRFVSVILAVVCVIVLIIASFFISCIAKATHNKNTLGKTETKYTTDETGARIANIPFSDYIQKCTLDKNYITPEISEENSGEENSKAINEAFSSLKNGGTVYIPAGTYKISTVELKSNTTLFVSPDTKLVSLDCDENSASSSPVENGVITANDAENVTITGGGIINGCGTTYTQEAKNKKPLYALEEFNTYTRVIEARNRIRFGKSGVSRKPIISFYNCKNTSVNNIILQESAEWTFVINGGSGYDIHNVVIDNHMHVANTDGIDILNCRDVNISKCFIATGDDALVLKPIDGEISDVSITDCEVCSFANCFKIGTETAYDVSNVTVSDCSFFMPDGMTGGYSGIAIESADGANINNISISNIEMDGVSSPILIWLGNRMRYGEKEIGSIDNISIRNVNAVNTELPSAITGCKADGKVYSIGKVELENINVKYRDTKENLSVMNPIPEWSMKDYPDITRVSHIYFISHEMSGYWDLPCYGIFIRYADTDYSGYRCVPRSCNTRNFAYCKK